MNVLKDILYKVSLIATYGDMERKVSDVVFDSRKVLENSAFVAVKGTQVDGHDFVLLALEKGANILRVHDVKEAVEGLKLFEKLKSN